MDSLLTISSCLSINARRIPDHLAVVYEEKKYTYKELNEMVNRMANGLIALGLQKGEKVSLMMKNSDFFILSYFAIARAGGVVVPINFRLVAKEVEYIVNQSDSVIILADSEFEETIVDATKSLSSVRQIITTDDPQNSRSTSIASIMSEDVSEPSIEIRPADDLHILYTSGTTGFSKGALFDHQRVMNVVLGINATCGYTTNEIMLHLAPLFHVAQLGVVMLPGIAIGATHVIHRDFNPIEVAKTIHNHKITTFFGVPTMYSVLLQIPNISEYDFSSVKRCLYGSAPMAPSIVMRSMELFKTEQFYNLCGLTEGGPSGIYLTPEEHKTKLGASGKTPLMLTEVRVVDENGLDTDVGQVGEMILKGFTIMKEYYKKPEETEQTLRSGWLYTGDLAVKDEDGFMTLVDRKKDMIISGGENVYSVEVENALFAHDKIAEATIIGLPDEKWGEVVTAVIVLKEGETAHEEDIIKHCRNYIAGYKIPKKVIFTTQIPRNASGKVLKFRLRETFVKGDL